MQLPTRLVDDFFYPNPVNQQCVGDQRAMATPRYGLGAHQRDALLLCLFDKACQIFCKFGGLHVVGETAKRFVSPTPIRRLSASSAEASQTNGVHIADSGRLKRTRKCVSVKLWVVTRARHGTHINEMGHLVGLEQTYKRLQGVRGMAHGQYDGLGFRLQYCSPITRGLIWNGCLLPSWERLYNMAFLPA